MQLLLYLVVGIIFSAFAAFVFAILTLILGKFLDVFEVSGLEGGRFGEFYLRYFMIAGVYTFVALPLGNGLLGIAALAVAYKYVFDAGWVQAIVIGFVGGIIALVLFVLLVTLVLAPFGMMQAS